MQRKTIPAHLDRITSAVLTVCCGTRAQISKRMVMHNSENQSEIVSTSTTGKDNETARSLEI